MMNLSIPVIPRGRAAFRFSVIGPSWLFRGGIAKYTTHLAQELYGRNQLSLFITPNKQYPDWLYPGASDIDPMACPKLSWALHNFCFYQPWTWNKVIEALKKSKSDYILIPYWTSFHLPFLWYLLKKQDKPLIGIVHNFEDHEKKIGFGFFRKRILDRFVGFFHHNQEFNSLPFFSARKNKVQFHPLPSFKPQSISKIEARAKLGLPQDKIYFLFFGLIRPYKGLDTLLEALKALPVTEEVGLLVAGEAWSDQQSLQKKFKTLPQSLFSRVRLDWIPENETYLWFSATDAVVLPYQKASSSAIAAQAIAFRKPILATQTGSLKDIIQHNVNGLLCCPNSPEELKKILIRFLDPETRKHLNEKASANKCFSWDSYTDSLNQLAVSISRLDGTLK
jgi:glycosyltransferase involved in cell wall biosynthesis